MKAWRTGLLAAGLALGPVLGLAGAALPAAAPVFMSPEDATKVGAQEHPKILQQFGGAYDDPAVGAYVAGLAGRPPGTAGMRPARLPFTWRTPHAGTADRSRCVEV